MLASSNESIILRFEVISLYLFQEIIIPPSDIGFYHTITVFEASVVVSLLVFVRFNKF